MYKRWFDGILSGLGLLILSPIMILIAFWIHYHDAGTVFFRQKRVGKHGKVFNMLKFRSMVVNADKQGPYYTDANDQRITPVGRILRKTSLDELPQLINVFVGDMSLVGPRPDVPEQEKDYTPEEWTVRHQVHPGITGLAQASLRQEATPEQRKALDLEYANSVSLGLDIKILLQTVKQVVFRGSY